MPVPARPATIPFQPHPTHLKVRHDERGGEVVTTIARGWRPGDAARCQLCPRGQCDADGGFCVVVVAEFVAGEDCALYRLSPTLAGRDVAEVHGSDDAG